MTAMKSQVWCRKLFAEMEMSVKAFADPAAFASSLQLDNTVQQARNQLSSDSVANVARAQIPLQSVSFFSRLLEGTVMSHALMELCWNGQSGSIENLKMCRTGEDLSSCC